MCRNLYGWYNESGARNPGNAPISWQPPVVLGIFRRVDRVGTVDDAWYRFQEVTDGDVTFNIGIHIREGDFCQPFVDFFFGVPIEPVEM